MIFYTEEEIYKSVKIEGVMTAIEQFYYNRIPTSIPERSHLSDGNNTVLIMPSFDLDYFCLKLVGVAPDNHKLGKKLINGTVMLHDRKTLEPLAMFDGSVVTALRTGAIGGLSVKHLAKKSAKSVGIVGIGVQGWMQLMAILSVRDIQTVFLYHPKKDRLIDFSKRIKDEYPDLEVVGTNNCTELVAESDIVVTATTSNEPVLPDLERALWEGKHIVAVGSFKPTMQELPDSLLEYTTNIYVDTPTALTESGDMLRAKHLQKEEGRFITLEDLVLNGSAHNEKYTVFKSVGMSLFDLIAAQYIFEHNR